MAKFSNSTILSKIGSSNQYMTPISNEIKKLITPVLNKSDTKEWAVTPTLSKWPLIKKDEIQEYTFKAKEEVIEELIDDFGSDNDYSPQKIKEGKWEGVILKIYDQPIKFLPNKKKEVIKGPNIDATTMTAIQELASAYIFREAIKNGADLTSVDKIRKHDSGNFYKEIKRIWMTVGKKYIKSDEDAELSITSGEWLENFYKQNVRLLQELKGEKFTMFTRGKTDGYQASWYDQTDTFMEWVSKQVKQFKISKKDNWNPADVWLIKNEKKHREDIEEAMKGPTTSKRMGVVEANLNQFNEIFRQLFVKKQIMGISLKKVSGDTAEWKEVNVTEKFFKHIESIEMEYMGAKCKFGPGVVTDKQAARSQRKNQLPTKSGYFTLETQETMITLKDTESNTEFEIQIKANDSSKFDNLKYEPKDLKNTSARLGKATSAYVDDLVEYYGIRGWKRSYKDYPQSLATVFPFTKTEQDKYLGMITELKSEGVDIGNVTPIEAVTNIRETFSRTSLPFVANSKLMQVNWLYNFLTLSTKNRNKMVTDMIFLAEKAGRRYGPYGKLY